MRADNAINFPTFHIFPMSQYPLHRMKKNYSLMEKTYYYLMGKMGNVGNAVPPHGVRRLTAQ